MKDFKFTDEDKTKLVEFLNFVAEKAKFKLKTKEIIKFFHLLAFMQKELLPKVEAHIFEVKKIIEEEKKKVSKKRK